MQLYPLDLETGSVVSTIKRLRGRPLSTKFRIYSDHNVLESIGEVGEHSARVRRWLECLLAYTYTLEYRKGTANSNADFLYRLPQSATDTDHTGLNRLTLPDPIGFYLIRLWAPRRASPPCYVLVWVGSSPFFLRHPHRPTTALHQRRLRQLPPTGIIHRALRPLLHPQQLHRA